MIVTYLNPSLPERTLSGCGLRGRTNRAAAARERFIRGGELALVLVLPLLLAGCFLQGKQPAAQSTPAAPAPAAKSSSPPPPLSVPQTQVEIPPPQQVPEGAVAAGQTPPDAPQPAASQRPARHSMGPPVPSPAKSEPAAPPAVNEEPARPPIQEVLSPDDRKRLLDSAAESKREIRRLVELVRQRHPGAVESGVISRIEGMVKLSDDAEAKGDMREADALAQRALVLAKDLESGR